MNTIEHLRRSGVPFQAPLAEVTPVKLAVIGYYAPRVIEWNGVAWLHSPPLMPYAAACFLAIDLTDDGLMSGYLRIARNQVTSQRSESGQIHLEHFAEARCSILEGVTFSHASGTLDMTDSEFDQWLHNYEKRRKV